MSKLKSSLWPDLSNERGKATARRILAVQQDIRSRPRPQGKKLLDWLSDEQFYGMQADAREGAPVAGLVQSHISGREVSHLLHLGRMGVKGAQVELYPDMVKASIPSGSNGQQGGGKRGKVCGMSRGSRRRMMQRLAMAHDLERSWFLTLTYPDDFPRDWPTWKRHLKAFIKRLKRRAEQVGYVPSGLWRLELKARKSGANSGQIAPHFHLLLLGAWGSEDLAEFRLWLSQAWYEVVNSGDEKHLYAGTQCKPVESRQHAMHYVSKYIAKEDADFAIRQELRQLATGRVWGIFGGLDTSPLLTLSLPATGMPAFRRLLSGTLKARDRQRYARYIKTGKLGFFVLGLGTASRELVQASRTTLTRWLSGAPPLDFSDPDTHQRHIDEVPYRSTIERILSQSIEAAFRYGGATA